MIKKKLVFVFLLNINIRLFELYDCYDISELYNLNEFEMISKEDIYTFIDSNHRNKKIDEEEHDFTRLGKGNRGFVVGFNLLDRRFNKTFPVALKTIKIKNDDTEQIKNEIKAIQDFSQKYPYSSLRYLTCFKEFKTERIFILTERLQYNLKNMNWKKKLQNFTQA